MNLYARVSALAGRRQSAESLLAQAEAESGRLRTDLAVLEEAERLLKAFAEFRRETVSEVVQQSLTAAVQQVFGPEFSALLGDPDAGGNKASTAVFIRRGEHFGEVRRSFGYSTRNVIAFTLWLELFWLLRQMHPNVAPLAIWDEPFLNLRPEKVPLAGALLAGCGELGIQTVIVTNLPDLVPEGATVIRLSAV